jgi:hypothetical protein
MIAAAVMSTHSLHVREPPHGMHYRARTVGSRARQYSECSTFHLLQCQPRQTVILTPSFLSFPENEPYRYYRYTAQTNACRYYTLSRVQLRAAVLVL